MHKEQERQSGLHDLHYHHAYKHLRRVDILIGNDELKPCKGQYAKVDDQVFPNSTTLMFFGGSHSHMLQPRSISVGQVQKIDQRHHEHPNDINEVPIKAKDFKVMGFLAAALISDSDNNQNDYASGDMRKVQPGDAKMCRSERPGSPAVLKQCYTRTDQRNPPRNRRHGTSVRLT